MIRKISAPINICLFLTEVCNLRCEYCLNFWRHTDARKGTMSEEDFDRLVEMFVKAQVFYVILNGGEPMTKYTLLEHALLKLRENNISYTVNSNLTLADEEKLRRLIDAGMDHVLTSFICHDPKITDETVGVPGTFDRMIRGIKLAVKMGVRVDANMVVGNHNSQDIYKTGQLAHSLGCDKFFGTRLVPVPSDNKIEGTAQAVAREDAIATLDELLKLKNNTGIMVGSLVSYPLCLLGDLEKYADFVTRGCPSQSGRRMSIYANGDYSACPHEPRFYGNVFKEGLIEAWNNISTWREGGFHFEGCEGCDYIDVCNTGCRTSSLAYFNKQNGPDPLMTNKNNFVKKYRIVYDEGFLKKLDENVRFTVPGRIRFRKEEGFYLVNIRWGNTISVDTEIAEFLLKYQQNKESFCLEDFGKEKKNTLANLFFKDVVENKEMKYGDNRHRIGLSVDPSTLK
ncbi:MAG: radical SAM protein [Chitinivibrionales bacterium]|nr:radical SAM protein [Chitinivibrionales bacterium]